MRGSFSQQCAMGTPKKIRKECKQEQEKNERIKMDDGGTLERAGRLLGDSKGGGGGGGSVELSPQWAGSNKGQLSVVK